MKKGATPNAVVKDAKALENLANVTEGMLVLIEAENRTVQRKGTEWVTVSEPPVTQPPAPVLLRRLPDDAVVRWAGDEGWVEGRKVALELSARDLRTALKRGEYAFFLMDKESVAPDEAVRLAVERLPGEVDAPRPALSDLEKLIQTIHRDNPTTKAKRAALTQALRAEGTSPLTAGLLARQHFPDEGTDAGMVVV